MLTIKYEPISNSKVSNTVVTDMNNTESKYYY